MWRVVSAVSPSYENAENSLSASPCTFSFFFARHFCAAIRFLSNASNTGGSFALPFPFSTCCFSLFAAFPFSEGSVGVEVAFLTSTGGATTFDSVADEARGAGGVLAALRALADGVRVGVQERGGRKMDWGRGGRLGDGAEQLLTSAFISGMTIDDGADSVLGEKEIGAVV